MPIISRNLECKKFGIFHTDQRGGVKTCHISRLLPSKCSEMCKYTKIFFPLFSTPHLLLEPGKQQSIPVQLRKGPHEKPPNKGPEARNTSVKKIHIFFIFF